MAAARKPQVDDTWIRQRGIQAYDLSTRYKDALEERLPLGTVSGLNADLTSIGEKIAAPSTRREQAKAATATQNSKVVNAHALITAISKSVARRSTTTEEAKTAYGVGTITRDDSVAQVVSRGNLMIERATAFPEEARSLGVLDSDIEQLATFVDEVEAADEKQERLRAAKPQTTQQRNEALNRIYTAIKDIAAAGVLAFALDPVVRAEFDALDDLPKA